MKSIVQEASSVSKAIDYAYRRADKPVEFSVRIHEFPKKNMFGFTTKSAKISLFYQEDKKDRPVKQMKKRPRRTEKKVEKAPAQKQQKPQQPQPERNKKPESSDPWSPEMVSFAKTWMGQLLSTLEVDDAAFEIDPQRYHLKITFTKPVFEDNEKNRILFRNCAHLLLQSARNTFKRPLKGFKVVLTTA